MWRERLAAIGLRTGRVEPRAPRLGERTRGSGYPVSLHVVSDAVLVGGIYADRPLAAFDARTARPIRWRLPAGLERPYVLAASQTAILLAGCCSPGSGLILLRR